MTCTLHGRAFGSAFWLLIIIFAFFESTHAAWAESKLMMQQEAANSFVFDRSNQNELPTTLKLSPFAPPINEYRRFEDMSKADRRIALSQVAIGLIGKTIDNDVARAMLALTDPISDADGSVGCKQRFSSSGYRLRCRIKF